MYLINRTIGIVVENLETAKKNFMQIYIITADVIQLTVTLVYIIYKKKRNFVSKSI